jgi:MFS family permease
MTLAGSFWWLMGLYFLLQVSENSAQGPYQGLLPDVVPEAERSTASGFVGAGNLTGLLLGTVVVGTFLTQKPPDFTGALISMVVVLLIATVVVTTVVPDRARPFGEGGINLREVTVGTFMIDRRKHRDFLWLMASRLLILVAIAGLQSFAFFFFKDVFYRGSDAAMEAAANGATRDLLAVILVFALLSTLPAARVSHRVGRRPLIVLSGILGAIGTVGIILSPYAVLPGAMLQPVAEALHVAPGLAQSLYFGILIGIASGTFLAVDWAFLMDVIPADEAGRFLGFSNIATAGSGIVARFIGGPVIDIGNRQSDLLGQPAGYPVVFAIYIVFFVLGTVAIFKVRETRRRGAAAPPPAVGH